MPDLLRRVHLALDRGRLLQDRYFGSVLTEYRKSLPRRAAGSVCIEDLIHSRHEPYLSHEHYARYSIRCEQLLGTHFGPRVGPYGRIDPLHHLSLPLSPCSSGSDTAKNSAAPGGPGTAAAIHKEAQETFPLMNESIETIRQAELTRAILSSRLSFSKGRLEELMLFSVFLAVETDLPERLDHLCRAFNLGTLEEAEKELARFISGLLRMEPEEPRASEAAAGIFRAVHSFFESAGGRAFDFSDVVEMAAVAKAAHFFYCRRCPESFLQDLFGEIDERRIHEHIRHLARFTASYLSAEDLTALGFPEGELREGTAHLAKHSQVFSLVRTRAGALRLAHDLARQAGLQSRWDWDRLLDRSGAQLADFVASKESRRISYDGYDVIYYTCTSLSQFAPDDPPEMIWRELENSGNYPALGCEMAWFGVPAKDIVQMLVDGKAGSLVELEYMCREFARKRDENRNFTSGLANVSEVRGALQDFASIVRKDGRVISLALGYQGKAAHSGTGARHAAHERCEDGTLIRLYGKEVDQKEAVTHFIEMVLPAVAGSESIEMPSGQSPDTHSIRSGAVPGRSDCFVSLVLLHAEPRSNGCPGRDSIVTAIFHRNADKLKKYLRQQLELLLEHRAGHDVRHCLDEINGGLAKLGIAAIDMPEPAVASSTFFVDDVMLEACVDTLEAGDEGEEILEVEAICEERGAIGVAPPPVEAEPARPAREEPEEEWLEGIEFTFSESFAGVLGRAGAGS